MFTRNNHFHFFYSPDSKEPNYGFRLSSMGMHLPFAQQVLSNMDEILTLNNATNDTLTVPYSGGLDSEFLIRVALKRGLKVRPVFVRFHSELNSKCLHRARKTAQSLGLHLIEIELDILRFFESGAYLEYCALAQCHSPQIAMHLWLLDQLDDRLLILPGQIPAVHVKCEAFMSKLETWERDEEPCYFEQHNTFRENNSVSSYRALFSALPEYFTSWATTCQDPSYCRYFEARNRIGIPQFFLFTPEMIGSSLELWRENHAQFGFELFTQKVKHRLYTSAFPQMTFWDKRTGFEEVKAYFRSRGQNFDDLFRWPLKRAAPESHSHLLISLSTIEAMLADSKEIGSFISSSTAPTLGSS